MFSFRVPLATAFLRYGVGLGSVAAAAAVRAALNPIWGSALPFLTFFPATMLSAYLGGLSAGLAATISSAVIAAVLWLAPGGSLGNIDPADQVALLLFVASGVFMSVVCEALHRARARSEAKAAEAQREAVERSSLNDQLRTRVEQQRAVAHFGQRALAEGRIAPLLDLCVDLVSKTLGVEYAGIAELLADQQKLLLRAGVGWKDGMIGTFTFSSSESQGGYTLQGRRPLIVEDFATEARFVPSALLREHGVVSGVSVPIDRPDAPFGVLFAHTRTRRLFSDDDLRFLEGVANIVSLAIARARADEARAELFRREQTARADAEAANRAKDEFLAILSHELRTPLTAMYGWVRLLRAGTLDPRRAAAALEVIERNTSAQMRLVNDLLDVSGIIAGKLQLEAVPVQVAPLVERAVERVRTAAADKELQVTVAIDAADAYVRGDAERLEQVFTNLISNAVKFTDRHGSITVRVRRTDGEVEVTVSDTGMGIAPDVLPHVFDRFWQADSSTTRAHRGLGLGLSIVQHLVQLHGGTVRAESDGIRKGATFTVVLPLVLEPREERP